MVPSTNTSVPNIVLNNGIPMPQFGLGVYLAKEGSQVKQAILAALADGYRLIDTAMIYNNEKGVGEAIREAADTLGVQREDIFITTKLWNTDHHHDKALRAFDDSLQRLGLDYIDLYLIHWPLPIDGTAVEAWKALEEIYASKRTRAIGVSNFKPKHLDKLLASSTVVPAVNQIELHPHMQQLETRAYCLEHNIQVESYSPLKRAGDVLDEPVIQKLATQYGKTPAQIVLRWHIQEKLVVIPKSVTPSRIAENVAIFDFELSDEDMIHIRQLDREERIGSDPDKVRATTWKK